MEFQKIRWGNFQIKNMNFKILANSLEGPLQELRMTNQVDSCQRFHKRI